MKNRTKVPDTKAKVGALTLTNVERRDVDDAYEKGTIGSSVRVRSPDVPTVREHMSILHVHGERKVRKG